MLNPGLDPHALKQQYSRAKRIRIANVLEPAIAEAIAAEMQAMAYKLFCANGKGVAIIDLAEMAQWDAGRRAELDEMLMAAAAKADGFAYHGLRLTDAWRDGAPPTPLGRFHDALISPAMFDTIRTITGEQTFDNAFVQATRYLPGHYLPRHLDDPKDAQRKLAFVWGFSHAWDPDWGGLLQFYTDRSTPADALTPGWNTLDLFDVCHWHAVTHVAPYAQAPRLALSGWFVKGDPLAARA